MQQFNLKSILEEHNVDTQDIAKELFPRVKYPKEAFNRVLRGEANLDTDQVQVLAAYVGVMPADLFSLDSWKGSTEDGLLTLVKGEYKVKINYKGSFITIFKNASEIKQEVISSNTISLIELIKHIDKLITNI